MSRRGRARPTRTRRSANPRSAPGQDGSYLAELLLGKNYEVFGLVRRKSSLDYGNAAHIAKEVQFIAGDMTDSGSLGSAVKKARPDEVYNLAAQSFVATSWTQPLLTAQVDALGVANILEAIRREKPDAKFYQASTSELYGGARECPQDETVPFHPRSPYGVAKLYGHWITKNYRESYNLFACAGILFNHESERRGKEFVTRKITSAVAAIKSERARCLELGNLSSKRDWGHAEDFVRAMWLMLQQNAPDEYVIATGETHTVREFAATAFKCAGYDIRFEGEGESEVGIDCKTGGALLRVNPKYFRPAEVDLLRGNPEKARRELGWKTEVSFDELVRRMVENDIKMEEAER
ncbi:GDP-mannose 4,6-dehydratase [Clostridia bacterium]|nr:GDP-mannose 4,6-dehydratase [Clostridia bacterium]